MYIRDCGYGRSKRCRRRIWPVVGMCILMMGMGGVTIHVMAGQMQYTRAEKRIVQEIPKVVVPTRMDEEMIMAQQSTVEIQNIPVAAETGNGDITTVEADEPLIIIDPGHGGEDNGCSREGVDESYVNLQIGLSLRDKLKEMGYEVRMTRAGDFALTLEERVAIANDADADLYISIHQNACDESNVSGIETWYNGSTENGEGSKRLAQLIHKDVILYTGEKDRGIVDDDTLHVIRETEMPSCLIETGFLSNAGDRESLTDEVHRDKIVEGIASGIDLYFHPKTMYLTFDDGPSPDNTEAILDILKERNIKATFFVIGENVRKNPETTRRIVEEGHTIGIHCNWHDYNQLYVDVDSFVEDFEKAYQTVYEVTGVKTAIFRFPGGSINSYNKKVYKDIIEEMTSRGYVYYDWNASLEDAVSKGSPEQLIQNAKESTLGRKKVVMLAHDTVDNTVLCLEELLEQFPEYEMKPLTPDVEPIQF